MRKKLFGFMVSFSFILGSYSARSAAISSVTGAFNVVSNAVDGDVLYVNGVLSYMRTNPATAQDVKIGSTTNITANNIWYSFITNFPSYTRITRSGFATNSGSFSLQTPVYFTETNTGGWITFAATTNTTLTGSDLTVANYILTASATGGLATVSFVNNGLISVTNLNTVSSNAAATATAASTNMANFSPILSNSYPGRVEMQSYAQSAAASYTGPNYGHSVATNGNYTALVTDDLIKITSLTNATLTLPNSPGQKLHFCFSPGGTNLTVKCAGGTVTGFSTSYLAASMTLTTNTIYYAQPIDGTGTNWGIGGK